MSDKFSAKEISGGNSVWGPNGKIDARQIHNYGSDKINWEKIDYQTYLAKAETLFVHHMERCAGAKSSEDSLARYVPLQCQKTEKVEIGNEVGHQLATTKANRNDTQTIPNVFDKLLPGDNEQSILITGQPGCGKTTLLHYELNRLSKKAQKDINAPLPLLISLPSRQITVPDDLLQTMSEQSGLSYSEIFGLWREANRPICLMLDGLDEVGSAAIELVSSAIINLITADAKKKHRVIIACRPDVIERVESLRQLLRIDISTLRDKDIDLLTEKYEITALSSYFSDFGLNSLFRTPNVIAALAHVFRKGGLLPRNLGELYQQYVKISLPSTDTLTYSYSHIVHPILAELAFTVISEGRSDVICNEKLIDRLFDILTDCENSHTRRRNIMPSDWIVTGFIEQLGELPFISLDKSKEPKRLNFVNSAFRDYFAAQYILKHGAESPEIAASLDRHSWRQWWRPLVMLAGLSENAQGLFDKLFEDKPVKLADLWLEGHTDGVEYPTVLTNYYMQIYQGAEKFSSQFSESYSTHLLGSLIEDESAQVRLATVGIISQLGVCYVPLLLRATKDLESIVSVSAKYALLRIGEVNTNTDSHSPVPPLFVIEGSRFSFESNGSCLGNVGSIYFANDIQIPGHIKLQIEHLDFNPFTSSNQLSVRVTSIEQVVTDWFNTQRRVDWIGLCARLDVIAANAREIFREGQSLNLEHGFLAQLERRYIEALRLARVIRSALGILNEQLDQRDHDVPETEEKRFDELYQRLRSLYDTSLRRKTLDLGAKQGDSESWIEQIAERVETDGIVIGVAMSAWLKNGDSSVNVEQYVENLEGILATFLAGEIEESKWRIPYSRYVQGNISIEQMSNANLYGLLVSEMPADTRRNLRVDLNINIEKMVSSQISLIEAQEQEWFSYDGESLTIQQPLDLDIAFSPLIDATGSFTEQKKIDAHKMIEELKTEISKQDEADDYTMGGLIEDLGRMMPDQAETICEIFEDHRIVTGPATQYVLGRLKQSLTQ